MNCLGARIEPLRGLLYDPRAVGDLSRVVAPPYDVISEAQQRDLYERSPYNVVRLELGRDADRYAAAQATLRDWVSRGVLRRAGRPSLFLYTQRFQVEGREFGRTGFVGRFRLEDFARGRVLPHEKTFPAAKDDRLMRGLATDFIAAHWHSDIFDLPAGATALASSDKTPVQGLRYGEKANGLLFHAEMTAEILAALIAEFGDGLKRVGIDGDAILVDAPQHLPQLARIGETIFTRWAAPIQGT